MFFGNSQAVECLSTSDFFNACATIGSNQNVPNSGPGFEHAKNGIAYVGFLNCYFYREYIQIKLSQSLIKGNTYKFSFYANLANYSNITTNQVGLKFVNDSIIYNQYLWEIMSADWVSNEYITDTVDWQLLKGEYTAKEGEQWVIIGNFYPDTIFPNKVVDSTVDASWLNCCYIYIDDFSVNTTPLREPNVFTPNDDGVNDVWFTGGEVTDIVICNHWGDVVFSAKNGFIGWDGKDQNGKKCNDGVYYYILNNASETSTKKETHKGFITLLR